MAASVGPEVVVQTLVPLADVGVRSQTSPREVIAPGRQTVSEPEAPRATDMGGLLVVV